MMNMVIWVLTKKDLSFPIPWRDTTVIQIESFFESKLSKSPDKAKIDEFIGTALSKVSNKFKDDIAVGTHDVSNQQSDLKNLNKKIQIKLATKEIENSLDIIRAKDCSVVTNEDYKRK